MSVDPAHDHFAETPPLCLVIRSGAVITGAIQGATEIHHRGCLVPVILPPPVVTDQGEVADRLFLLIKGSARYFFIAPGGQKLYLLWLTAGEIFGGAALLAEPSLFLVSTEIVKDSCSLVWERNTIRNLAEQYPRLVENGLAIATDYLTWYMASHASLVCHSARQRLAQRTGQSGTRYWQDASRWSPPRDHQ